MNAKICKYWSNDNLKRWFGVSRSTAWRARKRGYIVPAYHKKEIKMSNLKISVNTLMRDAKVGAIKAYKLYFDNLNSFDLNDLIQEGLLRLLELSGHQNFKYQGWRVMVARNAASTFIRIYLKKGNHLTINQNTGGFKNASN